MSPRRLELDIGEIVLEGFSDVDRSRLAAAVERSLQTLLHERGIPPHLIASAAIRTIPAAALRVMPGASVEQFGASIAESIYQGLSDDQPITGGESTPADNQPNSTSRR